MIPVSSARLTFRSWTEKDAALAEALWCDSEVTHYFGGAMTREQAHNRLDIERERENRLGVQYWPMFLREAGEFVGCAGLRQWQMDPKMIEAGVHLMRSSWGLRLGEEALRAVLAYGFETLGLPTIVAGHGIGHNNSQNHSARPQHHQDGCKRTRRSGAILGHANIWTLSVKQGANVIVLTVYGAKSPDQQRSAEESLARLALKRL